MLITNWPDKCPHCENTRLRVSSTEKSQIYVRGAADEVDLNQGSVRFTCRSGACGESWIVTLVTVNPSIALRDPTAMAVVAPCDVAGTLLALEDDYQIVPLSHLVNRGGARMRYVRQEAERILQTPVETANADRG